MNIKPEIKQKKTKKQNKAKTPLSSREVCQKQKKVPTNDHRMNIKPKKNVILSGRGVCQKQKRHQLMTRE